MVRKLIWKCLQFQSQSRKDFLTSGKNVSSNQKAAVKVNQPNEKAIKFPQNIECENLSNHKINKLQHGEYFARYLCTRFFFIFLFLLRSLVLFLILEQLVGQNPTVCALFIFTFHGIFHTY